MPVRRIPKTFRSISGRFPSVINGRCIGYESKLERDFYLTLEFDPMIASYEEQPLRLSGVVAGKKVSYTPDCLIIYTDGRPDRIVEVKSQSELEEKASELEPRFSLARAHALEHQQEFVVVTENEIYEGVWDNYRFIYRFAKPPQNLGVKKEMILATLASAGQLTLEMLLGRLGTDRLSQARYTTAIWHLIFTREIEADFALPIDYTTIMRVANGQNNLP